MGQFDFQRAHNCTIPRTHIRAAGVGEGRSAGLWQDKQAIPLWGWRKAGKTNLPRMVMMARDSKAKVHFSRLNASGDGWKRLFPPA